MSFFDNLKAAAIEKVKEKVKKELAELGIDLDEDDVDDAAAAADDEKENKDGEERPIFCAGPPSPSSASFLSQPDANTTFQEAVQRLWELDDRLTPNKDYKINVQKSKHPCNKEDAADDPLFAYVNPQVFRTRPTFTTFVALLNNYCAFTGEGENVTEEEIQENCAFLNEVMKTSPMKYCLDYCKAKGVTYNGQQISGSESQFKQILNSIWFELYTRSGRRNMDSSGFEHVFVGEVKDGEISGFHNWVQFYLEEKRGHVDFRGYIKPKCKDSSPLETNDDDPVLTLQFKWNGFEKFIGTCFIGVTPEFELALYTMAFLGGEDDEVITLDMGCEKFDLKVRCHKHNGNRNVGSCYVEALAHYE